ncbi:MAG: PEFG-CTERM sorting domain-containing protein, partial [Nitrosopumilaceae archaeon]
TILSKTDLTAKNAVDTQTLNLPGNGIYNVQINIKSIVGPTGLPDTSRIGMARGNLVIPSTVGAEQGLIAIQNGTSGQTSTSTPEFGSTVSIVLAISIISIIAVSAKFGTRYGWQGYT